jgi:hypothetical protein
VRVALVLVGFLIVSGEVARAAEGGEWQTYRDPNCTIECQYPPDCRLTTMPAPDFCALWMLLRTAADPETAWRYEMAVEPMAAADQQEMTRAGLELTARRFALWKAELNCAADGPESSTYCTGAGVRATFRTKYDRPGFEIEMTEVNESGEGAEREVEKRTMGPIYAPDLSDNGKVRVLFAAPVGSAQLGT